MDVKLLEKQLGLGKITSCTRFNEGFQNTIYLVIIKKKKYCLRIYNRRTKTHVLYELAVLAKLKDLPVPKPLLINGEKLFRLENKWAILYPYIEGKHLQNHTRKQLCEVGATLGRMHKELTGFSWRKKRFKFYDMHFFNIWNYARIIKKSDVPHKEYFSKIIKELKHNQLPRNLTKGAIHVDLGPNNVLFHKDKLSGFLDFDNGYVGPLILDLGKTVMFFASKNKKFNEKKARTIIEAYIKERPLTKAEWQVLDKTIRFAYLSHIFMDYYMRAIKVTTKEYFDWIIHDLYASYKDYVKQI